MKHFVLPLLFVLLANLPQPAVAKQRVDGSGRVVEQVRPLDRFSSISLDFVADMTVSIGTAPSLEITVDDNILTHIGTRVRGGTLYITQDKWIEPSVRTQIRIGVPTLSSLETSGYSSVWIEGVSGPRLSIDAGVGTVVASGRVDRLRIRSKTGTIDALGLEAGSADVAITSRGIAKINVSGEIKADLAARARIIQAGTAPIPGGLDGAISLDSYTEPVQETPTFVAFVLKNPKLRFLQLEVQGPPARQFSYGFSMGPLASRPENWPIGTQVFRKSLLGGRTLVYTVAEADSGKTIKLGER